MATPPPDAKYPDTIAITFDETNTKLTAVYNDHSVYVWDIFDIRRVCIGDKVFNKFSSNRHYYFEGG